MDYYCTDPGVTKTRCYGVDLVLCERHANEPIVCPKCGHQSPCINYGPGCP